MIKIKFLLIALILITVSHFYAGCSSAGDSSTTYNEDYDYHAKRLEKIRENNFKKAERYYELGLYDSAQHYCEMVINDPKYTVPAKTILTEITYKLLEPVITDAIIYIIGKNYEGLYNTLYSSRTTITELNAPLHDSLVYVSIMSAYIDKEYSYAGKYYELFSPNSKYKADPELVQVYEDYKNLKIYEKKLEQYEDNVENLEKIKFLDEESDRLMDYYFKKLEKKSHKKVLEFLYDEGFGRDIKFNNTIIEVFTKDYYFETVGYFKIQIDVWFSYGNERLFYEVSVPMINYRDKNNNVHWLD